ncbi:unnamed protein product [Linum tenue]|uniref:HAT C-terminal dimerisation domain-containing protein n=1 Tax=Linum tenue TaxID=586396 RepID=A0AAV0QEQ3_9ROSI|nr:unnamed protein product [Linum tenue]
MEINSLVNRLSHLCIKNPHILNVHPFLGQCIPHPFTSMANDVLSAGRDIIQKIRDNITYIMTSESRVDMFFMLKLQLLVPGDAGLLFEKPSQWSTTYEMLQSAWDMKEVFSCLDTLIPEYGEADAPTMEDWNRVEIICNHLKPLVDATNSLVSSSSSPPCPPAATLLMKAMGVHLQIAEFADSGDQFVRSFVEPMQGKMEEYWKQCGVALAIAVAMDPRYKMQLVEFSFPKIFGDESSSVYVKMVDDGVHELFAEYLAALSPPPPYAANYGCSGGGSVSEHGLADFDVFITETTTSQQQYKSELDRYLDEWLESRSSDLDVVEWWNRDSVRARYPTLSKMAMDILSIPVATA